MTNNLCSTGAVAEDSSVQEQDKKEAPGFLTVAGAKVWTRR